MLKLKKFAFKIYVQNIRYGVHRNSHQTIISVL